ncbi:MAG: V-type ATP synthase subunit F [Oscillospiraceae bacterium]|nr:V-type ATP synthase subunit F [Oscillospiraceae bacterium]MDD3832733.1 V-type ATP synthase subunit F [Oscillospiraceae bacterium]MDD4546256.1 V-type ATP synthase subunit F [Oscillospiraceae bacterium]
MYRVAAIGDRDSIYGFAAVGIEIFPTDSSDEAGRLLHRLSINDYAVIYITEELASSIEDVLDEYKDRAVPIIVPIPGLSGNTGMGMKSVSKSVERAVGSDIIS